MTRRDLALHLLRQAGDRGVTTNELMAAGIGSRYSARLLELREHGHVIESTRIRDGQWRYTLTRDAEQHQEPHREAHQPQMIADPCGNLFDADEFVSRPAGAYGEAA